MKMPFKSEAIARRRADAATKRTGTPHEIVQVDGGWMFRAVATEPADNEITDDPGSAAAFRAAVKVVLDGMGLEPALPDYPEVAVIIANGHRRGDSETYTAAEIEGWWNQVDRMGRDEDGEPLMTWSDALALWRRDHAGQDTGPIVGPLPEAEPEASSATAASAPPDHDGDVQLPETADLRNTTSAAAAAAYQSEVLAVLTEEGWRAALLEEDEPARLLHDGLAAGEDAETVAHRIAAWADRDATSEDSRPDAGAAVTPGPQPALERHAQSPLRQARTAPPRSRAALEQAARGVIAAWANEVEGTVKAAIDALRAALDGGTNAARVPPLPRTSARRPTEPRPGSKEAGVLVLLRRAEGATNAEIQAATGWQPHTIRGFLAGLKTRGFGITAVAETRSDGRSERTYLVPPNRTVVAEE